MEPIMWREIVFTVLTSEHLNTDTAGGSMHEDNRDEEDEEEDKDKEEEKRKNRTRKEEEEERGG